MAWIELHQSLVEHKKMDALALESGVPRDTALGRLCMLWLWTLGNREDGDLTGLDARRLGQILGLQPRRAASFLEALVRSGFLDRQGESLRVHDWEDYTGRLLEVRRKNAEKSRRARGRRAERAAKAGSEADGDGEGEAAEAAQTGDGFGGDEAARSGDGDGNADGNGDGDVTRLPNPTQPNPTEPNPTEPNPTEPSLKAPGIKFFDPGDHPELGAGAGNEKLTDYLLGRGLLPELWLGATEELLDRSRRLTDGLFKVFCTRPPGYADYAKVFPLVTRYREEEKDRVWDEDAEDLLGYAFEQAALAGAGGSWPYIDGVLIRLHRRGIRTKRQAEDFEERWQNGELREVLP